MTHEQRMALHGQLMAAKGANRVPGRVDPQTVGTHASDTVPAMLAPGEAVLNKHAAELMGRDKIAALNAVGEAHGKGMVGQTAPSGGAQRVTPVTRSQPAAKKPAPPPHQKLAGGTHMVGHGKSAKTPKKLDPQAVVQLMGMLKGGQPGMGAAPQMAPQGAPQMAPPQGGMA